jgi:hypothetical protein
MTTNQRYAVRNFMMSNANLVRDFLSDEIICTELAELAFDQFMLDSDKDEWVYDVAVDVANAIDRKRRR